MTWTQTIFFTLTLWTGLMAVIEGEFNHRADAAIWTVCAGVCLFIALMVG